MIPQISMDPKFFSLHCLAVCKVCHPHFATWVSKHCIFSLDACKYISLVPVAQIPRCFKSQAEVYCSPGSLLDLFWRSRYKNPKPTKQTKTTPNQQTTNIITSAVFHGAKTVWRATLSIQLCKNYNFLKVLRVKIHCLDALSTLI